MDGISLIFSMECFSVDFVGDGDFNLSLNYGDDGVSSLVEFLFLGWLLVRMDR